MGTQTSLPPNPGARPASAVSPPSVVPEPGARASVPARRCGRCQMAFPGDPTLEFQTDWALCPACSAVLLPPPATGGRS